VNTLLTSQEITFEALRVLENNLTVAKHVNREYDDSFAQTGAKIGATLNVRKPPKYLVKTGAALQLQDAIETQVPITMAYQDHVDFTFSTADLTLSIDNFSKRFVLPAIAALANKIDQRVAQLYSQFYNYVGTPGTTPNLLLTYLLANTALDNEATPNDGLRTIHITSLMNTYIVDALKGLMQQASAIAAQYEKGLMGKAIGLDWFMDQNMATHTIGAQGGTPLVNGANQTGSALNLKGWTAAAATRVKAGDIFQLGSVFGVNPQSFDSTGILRNIVATADAASDGSGNMTVQISPSIIPAGSPFQTVSALAADGAAVTMFGAANTASPQGLAFHRDAIALVSADLELPNGVDMRARVASKKVGLSMRLLRIYDKDTDNIVTRVDVLYGVAVLRPEYGVRIAA
jgi:hypothetical protein